MKIRVKLTSAVVLLLASLAAAAQTAPPTKSPRVPAILSAQTAPKQRRKVDRAAAYYHYSLGRRYEALAAIYGTSGYAKMAIKEYRLAIENDPSSKYLKGRLAELLDKTSLQAGIPSVPDEAQEQ